MFWPINGLVVIGLIALDQASKFVVETLLPMHEPVAVFAPLYWFRTWNEGVAFSMLGFLSPFWLIMISLAIIALFFLFWVKTVQDQGKMLGFTNFGFALIIAGALGNLIDRFFHGHVIDFVLLKAGSYAFAVFNLADSFITIGVMLIITEEVLRWHRTQSPKP